MRKWLSVVLIMLLTAGIEPISAAPQEKVATEAQGEQSSLRAVGLGGAAAFAMGLSVIGAGYAVGRIGSAAIGAAAEKPELLTRSLLFVALAEGLAVLGFVIAIMILQRI